MFPGSTAPFSPSPRTLRRRLVRGLDVAVEFATLGEYGVEEVELQPREPASCGWDWPPRCTGRGRAPAGPSRGRLRAGATISCAPC